MRARTLITTGLAGVAALGLAGGALAAPQVTGVEATKAGNKKIEVDVATARGASAVAPRIAVVVQRRIAWARYTDWDAVLAPSDTVHSIARLKGVRARVGSTLSVRVRACDTTCATTTHSVTLAADDGVGPFAPLPPGSVTAAGAVDAAIAQVGAGSVLVEVKRSWDPVAAWKVVLRRTDGARVRVLVKADGSIAAIRVQSAARRNGPLPASAMHPLPAGAVTADQASAIAIARVGAGSTVLEIERHHARGVAWEVKVQRSDGARFEVKVAADGTVVRVEQRG
jgi:uncharacterized membrane protein YkoI